MTKRIQEPTPGEILLKDFLEPMGISQYRLAKDTGMPHSRVSRLIKSEVGITADTALRLSRYFGTTAELWLNLQSHYELRTISPEKRKELDKIHCITAA